MADSVQNSSIDLSDLKGYLRIPSSRTADDTVLQLALDAAKEEADQYLNQNLDTIPAKVKLGVLVWASVTAFREDPNIKRKSGGQADEDFRLPTKAEDEIREKYWSNWRKIPGDYDDN